MAIAQATDLVGYRPYLARVPERPGQQRHATGNTVEARRAAHALDLAAAGHQVAVVSSGDPGVFAMASAVIEQVAAEPGRWPAVPVTVLPGVTAAQAVAARVGAPLGHDYCVISLSDRLKPWDVIAGRIEKAAAADLVLALYNPASRRRTWQLAAVRDLMLRHRDPATPVVLGHGVGRAGERVTVTTLAASTRPTWTCPRWSSSGRARPSCTTGPAGSSCSRPGTTRRPRRRRPRPRRRRPARTSVAGMSDASAHDAAIREQFRLQAATWTDDRRFATAGLDWIVAQLAPQPDDQVLDVAAGAGHIGPRPARPLRGRHRPHPRDADAGPAARRRRRPAQHQLPARQRDGAAVAGRPVRSGRLPVHRAPGRRSGRRGRRDGPRRPRPDRHHRHDRRRRPGGGGRDQPARAAARSEPQPHPYARRAERPADRRRGHGHGDRGPGQRARLRGLAGPHADAAARPR